MRNGTIAFGLVSVPVSLYKAYAPNEVATHQVHKADGGGIKYLRMCGSCHLEVPYEEIGRAIEVSGALVALSDEEIQALADAKGEGTQIGNVIGFIDPGEVDPASLVTTYYLSPSKGTSADAYVLLRRALENTGLVGLCHIKLSSAGKEMLGVLRVRERVLTITIMMYAQEVREPDFPFLKVDDPELKSAEVKMAEQLVAAMEMDFEPAEYKDTYRDELARLAAAHTSGAPVPDKAPAKKAPPATTMQAALEASLKAAAAAKKTRKKGAA
jgi:DNA end-binding protein Ku